jgi:hypothetical protein
MRKARIPAKPDADLEGKPNGIGSSLLIMLGVVSVRFVPPNVDAHRNSRRDQIVVSVSRSAMRALALRWGFQYKKGIPDFGFSQDTAVRIPWTLSIQRIEEHLNGLKN